MNKFQIQPLKFFLLRPLMYIASVDRAALISFTMGFESVCRNDYNLSIEIEQFIKDKYGFKGGSSRWVYQFNERKGVSHFLMLEIPAKLNAPIQNYLEKVY